MELAGAGGNVEPERSEAGATVSVGVIGEQVTEGDCARASVSSSATAAALHLGRGAGRREAPEAVATDFAVERASSSCGVGSDCGALALLGWEEECAEAAVGEVLEQHRSSS